MVVHLRAKLLRRGGRHHLMGDRVHEAHAALHEALVVLTIIVPVPAQMRAVIQVRGDDSTLAEGNERECHK